MATAVETSSLQPKAHTSPASLSLASLAGAIYVLATLAVVFYAVPSVWAQTVGPSLAGLGSFSGAIQFVAQLVAFCGLVWFGQALAGRNPPHGIRGGIFLVISAACASFFITRAVGLYAESRFDGMTPQIITAAVGLVLLFVALRLLTSPGGSRAMIAVEDQGWFHTTPYKRMLGQRVRRLTLLGLLLVGATGVYSLMHQGSLPQDWTITLPFVHNDGAADGPHRVFAVLADAKTWIPLLLFALAFWLAYRAVNMPTFAEFLIATEAEMNKVSWSSRKQLVQDTIVVLITTIFMALFLLAVDLFWGWLLSTPTVGVLPGKPSAVDKRDQQEAKW